MVECAVAGYHAVYDLGLEVYRLGIYRIKG